MRPAFTAGETIQVGWVNLPPGVEELEFFLVRGDSVEEIVRLTPQLVPARGSFAWKVPNLPSSDAKLRLRVGIDGEEIEIAESETFAVHSSGDIAPQIEFRDGEWWATETSRPWSAPVEPSTLRAAQPHQEPVLGVHRFSALLPPSGATGVAREADHNTVSLPATTLSRAPLVVPQRK